MNLDPQQHPDAYSTVRAHVGHDLEAVSYAGGENVAIECLTCGEVVVDVDRPLPTRTRPLHPVAADAYERLCSRRP